MKDITQTEHLERKITVYWIKQYTRKDQKGGDNVEVQISISGKVNFHYCNLICQIDKFKCEVYNKINANLGYLSKFTFLFLFYVSKKCH
jgi:hypothetical protein